MDFYLKFASEEEARSVLYTVTPAVMKLDEEGNETGEVLAEAVIKSNYANIDVLGVLYEKQDIVDPENPPEPVPYDGWFVNVRVVEGEDPAPLEPFNIDPKPYPMRVWA